MTSALDVCRAHLTAHGYEHLAWEIPGGNAGAVLRPERALTRDEAMAFHRARSAGYDAIGLIRCPTSHDDCHCHEGRCFPDPDDERCTHDIVRSLMRPSPMVGSIPIDHLADDTPPVGNNGGGAPAPPSSSTSSDLVRPRPGR